MMGVNNHPGYDFINDNNELLGRWFEIKWVNKNINKYIYRFILLSFI